MESNTKKIAAMTAVLCYMQEQQKALEHGASLSEKSPAPLTSGAPWSYLGLQSQMMYRNMIQMRQVPGWNK